MVRVQLPPSLERTPTLPLAEVKRRLRDGAFDIVTSDVFDTLVWRPVAAPYHLFRTMGTRIVDAGLVAGHVTVADVADARLNAEQHAREAARERYGTVECTLEEIWDLLPGSWWVNGAGPADGVRTELDVEVEALELQPTGVELIDIARAAGARIELVSDTYLSAEQLTHLLTTTGLDLDDVGVHTSADVRENKWDGLLTRVIDKAVGGGPPEGRWLHIGDNPLADVAAAARDGAEVCFLDIEFDHIAVQSAELPWNRLSTAIAADGGRQAAVRETIVAAGELGNTPGYQFGAAVAGPLMAGFSGWASLTAERLGATHLHCLLREGGRIAELIDLVRPDGPDRVIVHASRWAMMRAAVFEGTPDEIDRALARRGALNVSLIEQAFGIPADDVAKALGRRAVPNAKRDEAIEALAGDDTMRAAIVEASAKLRRNVVTYLERTLRLDDGPLVLCDIGWGGSIQETLTEIVRDMGFDNDVVGLYVLQSPAAFIRRSKGARIRSYLPNIGADGASATHAEVLMRQPEFLERVNTPPVGTLLGFDDDGTPQTMPDDHDTMPPSLVNAQRGVIDFCRHLATMALPDQDEFWFDDERTAAAALEAVASVVRRPTPELAEALGAWEHDDVAGTDAEALVSPEFQRWAPFLSAYDAGQLPMSEVFWVNGSANPTLAADIELLRDGADVDAVSPKSDTGHARVAAFEHGSDIATHVTEGVPRLARGAWQTITLDEGPAKLRSIRIDTGATAHLVTFGDARVVIAHGDDTFELDGVDALLGAAKWVDGRRLGPNLAVVRPGGHLVIEFEPSSLPAADNLWVRVAYRTTALDDDALAAIHPAWRTTSRKVATKLAAARTRLPRRG